jgi:hypothetical protein
MNDLVFIDEIIGHYYSNIGDDYKSSLKPGQIVWSYFLYNFENLEFWRPADLDDTCARATLFNICSSVADQFNRKKPLIHPHLEVNEEFIVIRAKRRPAIIITLPPPEISITPIRGGRKVNLKLCLLAPVFSLEDIHGNAKYPPDLVNRVRKLEYPHFFFLPACYQAGIRNSLCRFDRIFSIFVTHLEPVNLCLIGEAFDIFFSQLKCYLTGTIEGDFEVAYELLNR